MESNSAPQLDRIIIETPEHIQISYDVAGLGSRFVAVLLDGLLQTAAITLIVVLILRLKEFLPETKVDVTAVVIISFSTLISLGYFIVLELAWKGQSVGKRLMGLRVIRTNGTPVGFSESAVRNILRLIDLLPFFYGVGALSIFFSQYCQRVGDLAAGTLVVRERFIPPPAQRPFGAESLAAPQRAVETLVARLSGEELALMERFMERRHELAPEVRYRLAEQVAAPLRARAGPAVAHLGPEQFLELIYQATLRR